MLSSCSMHIATKKMKISDILSVKRTVESKVLVGGSRCLGPGYYDGRIGEADTSIMNASVLRKGENVKGENNKQNRTCVYIYAYIYRFLCVFFKLSLMFSHDLGTYLLKSSHVEGNQPVSVRQPTDAMP